MRIIHSIFARFMRGIEEEMIRRLLRQRDEAWVQVDRYRRAADLRLGEFIGPRVTIERIEKRLRERV